MTCSLVQRRCRSCRRLCGFRRVGLGQQLKNWGTGKALLQRVKRSLTVLVPNPGNVFLNKLRKFRQGPGETSKVLYKSLIVIALSQKASDLFCIWGWAAFLDDTCFLNLL